MLISDTFRNLTTWRCNFALLFQQTQVQSVYLSSKFPIRQEAVTCAVTQSD